MNETMFYNQNGIRITNARALFGAKMYPIRGISCVQALTIPPSRVLPWSIGVALTLAMLCGACIDLPTVVVVAMGCFAAIPYWIGFNAKAKFVVVLTTSSGTQQALMSFDERHVKSVVDALNDAIVHSSSAIGV